MHGRGPDPWGFALDLLEHEAAHHGQLIRYLYGLDLPIPETWKRGTPWTDRVDRRAERSTDPTTTVQSRRGR